MIPKEEGRKEREKSSHTDTSDVQGERIEGVVKVSFLFANGSITRPESPSGDEAARGRLLVTS